MACVGKL